MKKVMRVVFVALLYSFVFAEDNKKSDFPQSRLYKKDGTSRVQKYNQSSSNSIDENKDRTQTLKHLKRRYDRNYTFKYKGNESLERDDFGYAPLRSSQQA